MKNGAVGCFVFSRGYVWDRLHNDLKGRQEQARVTSLSACDTSHLFATDSLALDYQVPSHGINLCRLWLPLKGGAHTQPR